MFGIRWRPRACSYVGGQDVFCTRSRVLCRILRPADLAFSDWRVSQPPSLAAKLQQPQRFSPEITGKLYSSLFFRINVSKLVFTTGVYFSRSVFLDEWKQSFFQLWSNVGVKKHASQSRNRAWTVFRKLDYILFSVCFSLLTKRFYGNTNYSENRWKFVSFFTTNPAPKKKKNCSRAKRFNPSTTLKLVMFTTIKTIWNNFYNLALDYKLTQYDRYFERYLKLLISWYSSSGADGFRNNLFEH